MKELMVSQKVSIPVTPAKAGVQTSFRRKPRIILKNLDSGFRRNDGEECFPNACEQINNWMIFIFC
jgi:hypothetical protein